MRAVIQRVSSASVVVESKTVGSIQRGFVVLLGVADGDTGADAKWIAGKISGLRVFEDNDGKMNLSLSEVDGAVLLISQFTLLGDCRRGRRPAFVAAANPEAANRLYEETAAALRGLGHRVETGTFRAHMDVSLVNDGPVTLLLDSQRTF